MTANGQDVKRRWRLSGSPGPGQGAVEGRRKTGGASSPSPLCFLLELRGDEGISHTDIDIVINIFIVTLYVVMMGR